MRKPRRSGSSTAMSSSSRRRRGPARTRRSSRGARRAAGSRATSSSRESRSCSRTPAAALGRAPVAVLQRSLEAPGAAPGDRLVPVMRGREEVWLSVTEAVMLDPLGVVAGRIFAFRDISGDRLVEQVKSDFVSTVSHELRTPLTSIYGFAETLLRQDVVFGEEERKTFLRYIASESQ